MRKVYVLTTPKQKLRPEAGDKLSTKVRVNPEVNRRWKL